ncbi:hypothetical protein [Pontibacter sp. SGAir0037]|uniref:hypothetical protein n=1 Tax=Pontibacter sp. SGAir0037 TaxID=2571030 RepID=UPI0010F923D9|nr:hypothetical protein [Pontibacter sp. SGAir0037]
MNDALEVIDFLPEYPKQHQAVMVSFCKKRNASKTLQGSHILSFYKNFYSAAAEAIQIALIM